ncbi:C15 family peptidase [Kangiella sediminilitoris]|uniref:Pyrrolidone-carboxylate peptidase n=1 Tax=Kangiella sediminilitoris TaxID=1144748 RepID=A0A1B3BA93_9GAMM|nr:hypothetical protein [Kangiella sediminilitoris]AOE49656.1 hypothetical protein KS2013_934 [Kangiella sediminilitoris]
MNNILLAAGLMLAAASSYASIDITVEEIRLYKADDVIPEIVNRYDEQAESFSSQLQETENFSAAKELTVKYAEALWDKATSDLQHTESSYDDRPLYWARLKMTKALRLRGESLGLTSKQVQQLISMVEHHSRGYNDIKFQNDSNVKILITGFDPFLLDRNIKQSNPSGVAALRLDNQRIEHDGKVIEIQSAMFPVRYQDFDDGSVETVVEPYLKNNSIDMLATISMGRENFDLEHFPGRRRSASAPDNNNLYSGGSDESPLIPKQGKELLQGPEFVEYSLPYEAMMKADGPYEINDNRKVTTLNKTFEPNTLDELKGEVAVRGGGGGYLSNEISYRTVNLGNKLGTTVPTGHIHTPRIQEYDKDVIKAIVEQIKKMLVIGVTNS